MGIFNLVLGVILPVTSQLTCFLVHFVWFTNWSGQTFCKKWVELIRHELLDYLQNLYHLISISLQSSNLIQDKLCNWLMTFLVIYKICSNTLMEQLFWTFHKAISIISIHVFPRRDALYLNDWELSILKLALLARTSSLLNCHKLLDVSE